MTTLNTLVKHFLSLTLIVLSSSALAENPIVKLETSEGDITVVLFADKSPKTVENFLAHVDEGFYENTVFHRIIDNFMVQGGGFDVDLKQKKTERKVINESKNRLHNDRVPWLWHGPATRIPLAASFSSTSATILDLTGHLSNRDTRSLVR